MWICPKRYEKDFPNVNKELLKLKGELEDQEARASLAKFLRHNIGIATEFLCGIQLEAYQEITLKAMLNRNYSMCVWSRGAGKSFVAAIYCILQCLFVPNSKILIAGPTFRTARLIFNYLEKIVDGPKAGMIASAFGKPSKRGDMFEWPINGGSICAIPLNGEKIRGIRANVLLIDEFLLMPKDIIDHVLKPFLVAPLDMDKRIAIAAKESELIASGKMEEKDRTRHKDSSKMIALSSASYTFENLYETYEDWRKRIIDEESTEEANYFISQLSYEVLPTYMVEQHIVEEARTGGSTNAAFLREYGAQFVNESDGYYSAKKMHLCTVPDNETPVAAISGVPGKKYILAIDPSFSKAKTSDFFAMSILELDEENKISTLVHGYAVAGGDLKNHIKYLYYILSSFNIVMICIDNAGFGFIDSANESEIFRKNKIKLTFFDIIAEADGHNLEKTLREARNQYNKESGRICFKQQFTVEFIRKGNQLLQGAIDHKKVWFASNIRSNELAFDLAVQTDAKKVQEQTHFQNVGEFLEFQDNVIQNTKTQCAMIEMKTTAKGTQSFDLPQHLLRDKSEKRSRKDNYTTLMLGVWAVKVFFDIKNTPQQESGTFTPIMI